MALLPGATDTAIWNQFWPQAPREKMVSAATVAEAVAHAVDERLDEVDANVPAGKARTMVAVAGTATTVQAVALDLPAYDPDEIHQSTLSREAAEKVLRKLAAMTTEERARLPVMAPGREDVIVAGATILARSIARWQLDQAVISERDILDGLALEMVQTGIT